MDLVDITSKPSKTLAELEISGGIVMIAVMGVPTMDIPIYVLHGSVPH